MHDQRMTFLTAALLPTLLALPGGALAQDNSKVVPANAQAKQYGSGWECKLGFRRDGAACVAIKLPANAFRTTFMGRVGRANENTRRMAIAAWP
jgi:hypothetical protein